jgi:hypothetical protein
MIKAGMKFSELLAAMRSGDNENIPNRLYFCYPNPGTRTEFKQLKPNVNVFEVTRIHHNTQGDSVRRYLIECIGEK